LPTVYDVPADRLIERVAEYLKNNVDAVKPPEWSLMVKTGSHVERPPQNEDWWYVRCASLLRKVYLRGPIGVARLRSMYGGRKDKGVRPEKSVDGGGAIIRKALQQLEEAGFIKTEGKKGRVITSKGRKLLDIIATEIYRALIREIPELAKY